MSDINLVLYNKKKVGKSNYSLPNNYNSFDVKLVSPSLIQILKNKFNFIQNIFLYVFSKRKFCILHFYDKEELAHYSYISGKSYRFPFMDKDDLMIGPCATFPLFRRKGLYYKALEFISNLYSENNIWIFAHENNEPSLRVIEKAGFKLYGKVTMNRYIKILKLDEKKNISNSSPS